MLNCNSSCLKSAPLGKQQLPCTAGLDWYWCWYWYWQVRHVLWYALVLVSGGEASTCTACSSCQGKGTLSVPAWFEAHGHAFVHMRAAMRRQSQGRPYTLLNISSGGLTRCVLFRCACRCMLPSQGRCGGRGLYQVLLQARLRTSFSRPANPGLSRCV